MRQELGVVEHLRVAGVEPAVRSERTVPGSCPRCWRDREYRHGRRGQASKPDEMPTAPAAQCRAGGPRTGMYRPAYIECSTRRIITPGSCCR